MSQSQNKILAIVLIVCMIFSMVPIYSMIAYGEDSEQIGLSEEIDSGDISEDSEGFQEDFEGSDGSEDSEGENGDIEDSGEANDEGEGVSEESDEPDELDDLEPEDVGTPTDVSLGQSGVLGTLGIMPFSLGFKVSGTVTLDGIELSGVTVELYDSADSQIETTTTDNGGYYEFLDQQNESYKVKVVYGDGYEESAVVNDADVVVNFSLTTPTATTAHVTSWTTLVGQFVSAGDNTVIEIPAGTVVYIDGALTVPSGTYTITGGGTLKRGTRTGRLITLGASRTLVLDGITIDGESEEFSTASQSVIYNNNGTLIMTNGASVINNNSSEEGGAIQSFYGGLYIEDGCVFDGNTTEKKGSAIYVVIGTNTVAVDIDGAEFTNNFGSSAIYVTTTANVQTSALVEIKNCTIDNNDGGIYATELVSGGFGVLIDGCEITNNTASQGAGLYSTLKANAVEIKDSLFEGNTSTGHGGAIYTSYGLSIEDTDIIDNIAGGNGGGIYNVYNTAIVTIVVSDA